MRIAVFCLLALAALVSAQTTNEVKFVIDPFVTQSDTIVIVIPSGGVSPGGDPIIETRFVTGNDIMGGERDLQLTVTSGDGNLALSTGVSNGQYSAATPNEARGNSLLQLDGDDGSIAVNPTGLFGHPANDFTSGGAFALRVLIESDLPGNTIFRIISGSLANTCSWNQRVPGDDTQNEYILPYAQWNGTCDFTNVGAIEIFILMDDNIDVLIESFSTWGPVVTCRCFCPAFTCNLYWDRDDDYFSYYRSSQFGVFNPTTDFSTLYTPGDTNSFTPVDSVNSYTTQFTTLFSTFTSFSTGFSTFFSTFFSSFSSFTSLTSFTISNGSSSSSGAASLTAGFAFVCIGVFALV